jgi:hypothetical protein
MLSLEKYNDNILENKYPSKSSSSLYSNYPSSSSISTPTNISSNINAIQLPESSCSENIFSSIVLNVNNYVYTLNCVTEDYCEEMLETLIDNFLNIEDQLVGEVNKNQGDEQMNVVSSNSLKRSREIDSSSDIDLNPNKKGGFLNEECQDNLIWCLEYGIPDSLHDFGKSRNGIFPSTGTSNSKNMSFAFLEKAESFLKNLYQSKYQGQNIQNIDKLYKYYYNNPANFEPNIKNNFLLGNICDQVENVFYFFSPNEELPNTQEWAQLRKDFYQQNTPLSLNNFFQKLVEQDYKYCMLDACMSIQKEKEWVNNIRLLRSLCNLWDPAGAGSFSASELTDGNEDLQLQLVKQFTYENYFLFDSQERTNRNSLYDAYDPLFNQFCLEKDNITFKLRIGTTNDGIDKYINNGILNMELLKKEQPNKSFQLFLLVFLGNNQNPTIFLIKSGGFSVKVLSYGLYFIENNKDYVNIKQNLLQDYNLLKNIILFINQSLGSIPAQDKKNKLYTLITRFKSSGDHGSALSTKFINTVLHKPTLYLSGDQLAYVYSILINNPTIFRYYNSSSSSNEEDENDDDLNNDTCQRIHFIGALLPQLDEKVTCTNKLNEIQLFFEKNILPTYSNQVIQAIQNLQELQTYILKQNEYLTNIKSTLFQQEDPVQINAIIRSNNDNIQKMIYDIYSNMKLIHLQIEGPQFQTNLPIIKNIFKQLNETINNIYFITNYFKAKEIVTKAFKLQVNELNKIININVEDIIQDTTQQVNKRLSSRNPGIKLSTQSSWLNNVYKKLKEKLNLRTFVDELKKTPSYESDKSESAYEDIIRVKKKYLSKITDISESMKEQFGISSLVMINESKTILDKYTLSIKNKLTANTNPSQVSLSNVISELFFGTIDPVFAVPIEEEDQLENEIANEAIFVDNKEPRLSKQKNTGIISNTAKKVINTTQKLYRKFVKARVAKRGGRYSKKRKAKKVKKTIRKHVKKYNNKSVKKTNKKRRHTIRN